MSMFDYDARPITPQVVLIGTQASHGAYAIRDFLSRNGARASTGWRRRTCTRASARTMTSTESSGSGRRFTIRVVPLSDSAHRPARSVVRNLPPDEEKQGGEPTSYMRALRRALGLPDEDENSSFAAMIAPVTKRFRGLAPPEDTPHSPEQLAAAVASLPPARIGLVPARRGADVLPLIGWMPSDQSDALPVAVVVRSWEDRFGARLLRVGFAEISLLIGRPPRSLDHAQQIAAEHFAFCDECAGQGLHDVASITASLMETPIWTFWWD